MDLEALCDQVVSLSKEVGAFIRKERKNTSIDIETKSLNSLVTYVDKESERRIVEKLKSLLPQSGFIAEEGTSKEKGATYNWIVDPLDGTTNFIHNIPCFSVSIALMRDSEIVLGVVYEINMDECFYSFGSGSFLNGQKIMVSDTKQLKDTLLATGFPYYDYERVDPYLQVLKKFMNDTRGLRRMGSAAVDLVYVACGRFDGFYEYSLNPWDVAAGAFIVEQAGGSVSDFKNQKNYLFGKEIVATNRQIHSSMLSTIQSFFNI